MKIYSKKDQESIDLRIRIITLIIFVVATVSLLYMIETIVIVSFIAKSLEQILLAIIIISLISLKGVKR